MVTIQNVSRRMQVYQLDHGAFQEHASKEHAYRRANVTIIDQDPSGSFAARKIPRMLPSALTFAAGETKGELPNEVVKCESVARAIKNKELRVVAQTADEATEETK
jgi:hypothetical protein